MLASDELKAAPREQQDAARTMAPALAEEIVKECRENVWTEAQRACVAGAPRMDDLEGCQIPQPAAQARQIEPMTVAAGAHRSLPECDTHEAEALKFMACEKVPQEAKDAQRQALEVFHQGIASLDDANVPPEANQAARDACKAAADALHAAIEGAGCAAN